VGDPRDARDRALVKLRLRVPHDPRAGERSDLRDDRQIALSSTFSAFKKDILVPFFGNI
jgi:hypothetical protein